MRDLPLPSNPGHGPEIGFAHWILDHPKLWGIVTLLAIAPTFSPRVSEAGVWSCLASAEVTVIAFGLSIAQKRRQSKGLWSIAVGVAGVIIFGFYGVWLLGSKSDGSSGFVQYEDNKGIVADSVQSLNNLRVGQVLKINFTMANRGLRPVDDVQSWGLIGIVDPNKNPGKNIRQILLESAKTSYDKAKGAGGPLGVNQSMWNTAVGTPITQTELDGLKDRSLRIHFMAFGAWTDERNRRGYWTHCEWTNWPGDATTTNWVWKAC